MTAPGTHVRKRPGDVTKLPKWAQARLELYEADKRYWKQKYLEAVGEVESDIYVGSAYRPEGYIPSQQSVNFMLDKDKKHYIEVTLVEGGIVVRGDWALEIYPESSNAVKIKRSKD